MKRNWVNLLLKRSEVFTLLFIGLYFGLVFLINPLFTNLETVIRILFNGATLSLVTLGVSMVMITKNIDVSVGSLLGLAATLGGAVMNATHSLPLVFITTIGAGVLGGIVNGIGVAYWGVTSIVMTLGTMAVFRGLLITYTGGKWIQTIPEFYMNLPQIKFLGIYFVVWIVIVTVLVLWFLTVKTRFGKYFYAVGNHYEGAKLQGIAVRRVIVLAYAFCGLLTGSAALIYIAQIGAVPNMAGVGLETQAIAAAVIGGISLNGGKGSMTGALLGSILLQTVNYSLGYLKVPGYWNNAISGFMLLSIIVGSSLLQQYMTNDARKAGCRPNKTMLLRRHHHENIP